MHECTKWVRTIGGPTDKRACGLALVDGECPMPLTDHMTQLEVETIAALRQVQLCIRLAREKYGLKHPLTASLIAATPTLTDADSITYGLRLKGE